MHPTSFSFLPSPFCDHRPPGTVIDLLVVHAISLPPGCFGGTGVDDLFLGRLHHKKHTPTEAPFYRELAALRVSAHFLIDRTGRLTQYVPILGRAWHAGQSVWQDRQQCNDFSIGVELEGDEKTPFEPVQYHCLATLTHTLQEGLVQRGQAGFTHDHITGHQDIAPERKWDPGPFFEWDHFYALLLKTHSMATWPLIWEPAHHPYRGGNTT